MEKVRETFGISRTFSYLCASFLIIREMRVISKESVKRANAAMINGKSRSVSIDSSNMAIRCCTIVGDYTMVVPREKVLTEARKAFVKVVK